MKEISFNIKCVIGLPTKPAKLASSAENAKLKHEIQKLRSDFNTILTRYSMDSSNPTGSIPNLAKQQYPSFSSVASSENFLNRVNRREPVDVPA